MKNLWRGAFAILFLGLSVALFAPACVDNESSLFVRNVAQPSCDLITTDSPEIGEGFLDTRYQCGYSAVLIIGNQLVKRGDDNKLQTETSRVEIKGADVQVLDSSGAVLGQFSAPAVGFVDPANATNPGYGLTEVLLIDGATGQKIDGSVSYVVARVVVRGRTLGGLDLTTAPFEFPINVCNGCLCQIPPDDTCTDPQSTPTAQCWIKQDAPFDCRFLGGDADCNTTGQCGVLNK